MKEHNNFKVKFIYFTIKIASTFISAIAVFSSFDIDNKVKAIVVSGDPSDYIVKPGSGYDGVALLESFSTIIDPTTNTTVSIKKDCTGTLLSTGLHVLTAAHCLTQSIGDETSGIIPGKFNTFLTIVNFESPLLPLNQRFEPGFAAEFYIHPDWNGDTLSGSDLAIIKLSQQVSPEIDSYDIYRTTDELSQVVTKVGYGATGNGNTGASIQDGLKRSGQNTYEILFGDFADAISLMIPSVARKQTLGYDFDNGLVTNDFLGYFFDIPNIGLGVNEVSTFVGDSGSPGFINNLVAGISSFGGTVGVVPPDIDTELNGSFGEFAFDTRVSYYAKYIDDVLAGKITPTYKIPEPSNVLGNILALSALVINSRLRRTKK